MTNMVTTNNTQNQNAINDVRRKVNEVLTKEDRKISVGWRPPHVERNEGDTWTDEDGRMWERKNGYTSRITKLEGANTPWFCPECKSVMQKQVDTKFWRLRDKCSDCVIKEETQMKLNGTYEEYAARKLKENYVAAIKDKIHELEDLKETITSPSFVHADDTRILMIEKWNVDIDKIKDDIQQDIDLLYKTLEEAEQL